jgi:drug/metabolite transporter (DMT)-like permease
MGLSILIWTLCQAGADLLSHGINLFWAFLMTVCWAFYLRDNRRLRGLSVSKLNLDTLGRRYSGFHFYARIAIFVVGTFSLLTDPLLPQPGLNALGDLGFLAYVASCDALTPDRPRRRRRAPKLSRLTPLPQGAR